MVCFGKWLTVMYSLELILTSYMQLNALKTENKCAKMTQSMFVKTLY